MIAKGKPDLPDTQSPKSQKQDQSFREITIRQLYLLE